jgi:hypothetical protein
MISQCLVLFSFLASMMLFALIDVPSVQRGDIRVGLSIEIPEEAIAPGNALVGLRFEIEPRDVEVVELRLEDALNAWRIESRMSAYRSENARTLLVVALAQTKPGLVNLPGIRLRLRSTGQPQEFLWTDLLTEPRDAAPPIRLPEAEQSAGSWQLWIMTITGLILVVWLVLNWRRMPKVSPLRERWLAELNQANTVDRLSALVREAIAGEGGAHQTSEEVLARLERADLRERAGELLAELDLAKYAGRPIDLVALREKARAIFAGMIEKSEQDGKVT